MNSSNKAAGNENAPKANESDWYDGHYATSGTAPSLKPLTGDALLKHLGPWYGYALPHLRSNLLPSHKILELGCGTGRLLTQLYREKIIPAENIYGLDQSLVAVDQAGAAIPAAKFSVGDIYKLNLPDEFFNTVLLMEVIEHLDHPEHALSQIFRVTAKGGLLYVSFPNYVHLPWLAVRMLAQLLNRPNWIVLQPIDKIYTVFGVKRLVEASGFTFIEGIGANYGPPLLYPLEKPWITKSLNRLGLWWMSFHPVLVFRKNSSPVNK